ncbi:UPF0488 protein C8orf33 homolog [Sycon ciliatum]|uniref:UPF0488 protein C8orf33 homolog n=1 Tax=Sycon ciliatum TaxID=27933 RepID=UPI0031F65CB3
MMASVGGLSKSQKKKLKKKRAAERGDQPTSSTGCEVADDALAAAVADDKSSATDAATVAAAAASVASTDVSFTVEEEILWCVHQLQLGIKRLKSSQHAQAADAIKLMNTLQSAKAPLPRKRQLMRGHFGDYRAKMRAELKSQAAAAKEAAADIRPADTKAQAAAGTFVRRARHTQSSAVSTGEEQSAEAAAPTKSEDAPFRFSFGGDE